VEVDERPFRLAGIKPGECVDYKAERAQLGLLAAAVRLDGVGMALSMSRDEGVLGGNHSLASTAATATRP
jgi:hypothetical protein